MKNYRISYGRKGSFALAFDYAIGYDKAKAEENFLDGKDSSYYVHSIKEL